MASVYNNGSQSAQIPSGFNSLHSSSQESSQGLIAPEDTGGGALKEESKAYDFNKPLAHTYKQMSLSSTPVTDGYGEYILYLDGLKEPLSEDLYNKAFEIIHSKPPREETKSRSTYIEHELIKIDPNLRIVFVPRTLYDLFYIKASIEEEMTARSVCPLEQAEYFEEAKRDQTRHLLKGICVHLCHFSEDSEDHEDKDLVSHISYRINALAIETLNPKGYLTGCEIALHTNSHIGFLQDHAATFPEILKDTTKFESTPISCSVAINFAGRNAKMKRGLCYPMEMTGDTAAIVQNAVALECSRSARKADIIYRGENPPLDGSLLYKADPANHSLSYGTSLFAGCVRDPGACALRFHTIEKYPIHALLFQDSNPNHPFYIPKGDNANPIRQMLSSGEFFHPRALLPDEVRNTQTIEGIDPGSLIPEHVFDKEAREADEIAPIIDQYRRNAIFL